MSYEKVKSISLKKKENKIMINGASSNVQPITYYSWEFMSCEKDYHKKELELMRAINGGGLVLNESLYKWRYALMKTNSEIYGKDNTWSIYENTNPKFPIYTLGEVKPYYGERYIHIEKITDNMIPLTNREDNKEYYDIIEKLQDDIRINKLLEEYYNIFMKYLNEKIEGKYFLYSDEYGYIKPKGTKGSFYYSFYGKDLITYMDYKKAYCLLQNCDRGDMKIIKQEIREKEPTKEQLKEVEKRLKILGINELEPKETYISKQYSPFKISDKAQDLIKEINNFEKEYDCFVYHIIYTNTDFGILYNMLYVSNEKSEWEDDKRLLLDNKSYAYVYNSTDNLCSEIGMIGIENKDKIIVRTF